MDILVNKIRSGASTIKYDLPAGLVVFLVAIPLCLGIALASGAPMMAGLLTGVVGGVLVGPLSGSKLSVSGPAAGLTVIVFNAIATLGSYQAFLVSVIIAGIIQLMMGYVKAGTIANFFPSSVIKGMLAAIGIILILKQIPHAIGYDLDYEGDFAFFQPNRYNTFTQLAEAFKLISIRASVICLVSLAILILWDKYAGSKLRIIPGSLIVVIIGILLNELYELISPTYALSAEHLVQIKTNSEGSVLDGLFTRPDFTQLVNEQVFLTGITLAIVASLETLLCIEAVDKLDPLKAVTDRNKELKAQGIGNIVCGMIGGLPMTSVIVRSSANVDAGAKSKLSTFFHGVFLLLAIIAIPRVINLIPLASLSAILIMIGYKLNKFSIYKTTYQQGWSQFLPFSITILAIVFTDLLFGIVIGLSVAVFFILKRNAKNPYSFHRIEEEGSNRITIELAEEVSFLNKASIRETLDRLPENSEVIIDGSNCKYIDYDVLEIINEFKAKAKDKNIRFSMRKVKKVYHMGKLSDIKPESPDYRNIFLNNRKWVQDKLDVNPDYFENLAEGQSPEYLYIGCSDSRVPASEITGTKPGEMFVHRNVANLVVHTDINMMSVLEYAVRILRVKHIVVCGHYGCGGIKAALDGRNHGFLNKWLREIKDVYRLHKKHLDHIHDEDERHRKLVEFNVREQVFHLCMLGIVQKAMRENGLKLHGWVYDLKSGLLNDLNINVMEEFKDFDLYKISDEESIS
jgi:carbonic anhydrase